MKTRAFGREDWMTYSGAESFTDTHDMEHRPIVNAEPFTIDGVPHALVADASGMSICKDGTDQWEGFCLDACFFTCVAVARALPTTLTTRELLNDWRFRRM